MEDVGDAFDSETEVLPAGTKLGKYELVRALGQGGMGVVYEATHLEMGKRVAVKTLSPQVAAVPGAKARFLREAQLTSRVSHPHIVDVTDVGTDAGHAYLVMELLTGEDLSQRLQRSGPLPTSALVDLMLPVCSAVIAAHQVGIVHRDLKPQNIFLAEGPRGMVAKVLDFGISKQTNDAGGGALTQTSAMIGTPYYLAPEQIHNARSASPASDQYALGVILYECLSGQRPFEGETVFAIFQEIVAGRARPLRQSRSDLPPGLDKLIMRAMSVDVAARFASVRELGAALLPFASARARVLWEEAFATTLAPDAASGSQPAATPLPGRAVPTTPLPPSLTPPSPMSPMFPMTTSLAPSAPAASGFGTRRIDGHDDGIADGDGADLVVPRRIVSGRPLLIAAVVTILAAIAVVIWVLFPGPRRPSRSPSQATADPPVAGAAANTNATANTNTEPTPPANPVVPPQEVIPPSPTEERRVESADTPPPPADTTAQKKWRVPGETADRRRSKQTGASRTERSGAGGTTTPGRALNLNNVPVIE